MNDDQHRRYLTYIRSAIALIEARTQLGRDAFMGNVDLQDAILWRLETLAEATGKISPAIRERHPEIRWRSIYGFRNVAAHGYLGIDLEQVWEIIVRHLPLLKAMIDKELGCTDEE